MSDAKRPISSHPAFRLLVALWFAALLGFGTWVMPAAVFERAVAATGLADVLPAAAPPLGDTARVAISAVAALLGALLGLFVGARASRDETPFDEDEIDDTFVAAPVAESDPDDGGHRRRRLLNVREDLSEEVDPVADGGEADEDLRMFAETEAEEDSGAFAEGEQVDAVEDVTVPPADDDGDIDDDLSRFEADPTLAEPVHSRDAEPDFAQDIREDAPAAETASPAETDMELASAPPPDSPTPAEDEPRGLADLSRRLESALAEYRAQRSAEAGQAGFAEPDHQGEDSGVVAFPRPAGGREGSEGRAENRYVAPPTSDDPHNGLRDALDKLSRVTRER